MNLTGKCKEEFEKWLITQKLGVAIDTKERHKTIIDLAQSFDKLPNSMKWGVYQDYFDSVEEYIKDRILPRVTKGYDCFFTELKEIMIIYKARHEARTNAIEEANEIRNKQLEK